MSLPHWRGAAVLATGFALVAGACKEDRIALSIDLRTDFIPGAEFSRVVTSVVPDSSVQLSSSRDVSAGQGGFIAGSRVADFADLPPGGFSVRVQVLSTDGEALVERLARLTVSNDYALTVVVTRNCEGVVCPLPDGDPGLTTCLGGQCVQPGCSPEQPALCPAAECTGDSDCQADAPCVEAYCRAGTCLFVPDGGKCKAGQTCDVTRGCFTPGEETCQPSSPTETDCSGGVDEDCDGKIDCADPDCAARSCDDGNLCTDGDVCKGEACVGGPALDCDDENECTTDSCEPKAGCAHAPKATGSCDDQNACTDGDHCEAGKCVAGSTLSCDDKNPCTDDVCDAQGGCSHVNNAASCDDGNACTDGDKCVAGACKPGGPRVCNDKNPCTDDVCAPATGCLATNNTAPCDDGVFCNGADTCAGGTCSKHGGNPCKEQCNDSSQQCVGCLVDADCGPTTQGPWGDCEGFADTCATDGTQSRTVTTPKCNGNICSNQVSTETQVCARPTDGAACGDVTFGEWSACDYADVCDTSATRTRSVTTLTCAGGTCSPVVTQESEPCTRTTDGTSCQTTVVGSWSACGGFASACDTTGSETRSVTSYACSAGTCKATKETQTQSCKRTVANGTSCGSGKYCCSGSCFAKNDPNHCSSCGISCGGGKCQSNGAGQYSCTCGSNAQCVNNGFGAGATCYQGYCNCQCTSNNCCAGGADCYKPSGQNYCSY